VEPVPTAREYFAALWEGVEAPAFIELRTISGPGRPRQQFFAYPDNLDPFLQAAQDASGKANVYYGICPRAREGGKAEDVLCATALWADLDDKFQPRDESIAAIKAFPLRPSVGILTGGGIHCIWFLREPIYGNDLAQIPVLNNLIEGVIGGDNVGDLPRILRSPSTLNLKYQLLPMAKIAAWHPEARYNLGDFEVARDLPRKKKLVQKGETKSDGKPRPRSAIDIPDDLKKKIAGDLYQIWLPGYRNRLAMYVAGLLAHAGYSEDATVGVIQEIVAKAGDEEAESRIRSVHDTFKKFHESGAVAGGPSLKNMIETELPKQLQEKARHIHATVKANIRTSDEISGRNFEIIKIKRYAQMPPTYDVTIGMGEKEYTATCSVDMLYHYNIFCKGFFAEHHLFLPPMKPHTWKQKVETAQQEVVQIEKEEATVVGQIASAIDEFTQTAMTERAAESSIKHFPVKTDDGGCYFQTSVFMKFLKGQGVDAGRNEIVHQLKDRGWKSVNRRFGQKQARVWFREGTNGHSGTIFQDPG